ncbi:MAG TPA: CorA family divalent cation transporter, partial [Neobacillus sp.]
MIRTIAVSKDYQLLMDLQIPDLLGGDFLWYWVDFQQPSKDEIEFLRDPLQFHPLAIEDCIHDLQRPKLDYYEGYAFFVTQALNPKTIRREEVDIFLNRHYVVTFHHHSSSEIDEVWNHFMMATNVEQWDPSHVLYHVIDKMVDDYFPLVNQIDDKLNEIDENSKGRSMEVLLKDLFDTRHDLLSLRHTITPMRDLLYRIINSQRLKSIEGKVAYFSDIYDHLLKLTEMVEASRELTTDIRDSYISL